MRRIREASPGRSGLAAALAFFLLVAGIFLGLYVFGGEVGARFAEMDAILDRLVLAVAEEELSLRGRGGPSLLPGDLRELRRHATNVARAAGAPGLLEALEALEARGLFRADPGPRGEPSPAIGARPVIDFRRALSVARSRVERSIAFITLGFGFLFASMAVAVALVVARLDRSRFAEATARAGARRAIEAEEATRRAIARELHDDLAQDVAAARALCERAALDRPAAARAELLGRLRSTLSAAGDKIRSLSRDLRPVELEGAGLAAALEAHCARLSGSSGIDIGFESERAAGRLEPGVEIQAFRVAQAAIGNALEHAPGHRVRVRLEGLPDFPGFTLEVRDEAPGGLPREAGGAAEGGGGAPPVPGATGQGRDGRLRGAGLSIMRERAALCGGRLEIETDPASWLVRLRVPDPGPG